MVSTDLCVNTLVFKLKSILSHRLDRACAARLAGPRSRTFLANYIYTPSPWKGGRGVASGESSCQTKKAARLDCFSSFERKTRVCPSAPHSVYQAITFAQYYTPNSRDTWVVSRCRFRARLLPYKLQNYSCLRQIYE